MGANHAQMTQVTSTPDVLVSQFEPHRSRLFGLAYRMLGLRSDAEDIVQETYLRWHSADHSVIRSVEAWLVTVATRLCIDRLRSLETERLAYVGEWLPEPIIAERPEHGMELQSDISLAFMHLLQRLGPEERAALLLHDVLDYDYETIAASLNKTEPAVRQMVRRARERVRTPRARFDLDEAQHRALVDRFVSAVHAADENALLSLFTEGATWTSDGGGKVAAAINILHGNRVLTRFMLGVRSKLPTNLTFQFKYINGSPGFAAFLADKLVAVYALELQDARIAGVYAVLNPDKLRRAP